MRVKVIRGPMPIGLVYYRNGEQADLPDAIANVLIKVGRVEKVGEEALKARRVYRRADAKPEETAVMVAEPAERAPRRPEGTKVAKPTKAPKTE